MKIEQANILDIDDTEFKLFLQAIYEKYGYDYRKYIQVSLKRQLLKRLKKEKMNSMSELQAYALQDKKFFHRILPDFFINVTEFFRDPMFYLTLKKEVIPILKTYPQINIWHAGCSTGEEVYSMAIFLKEEGLYERTQIYATDINQSALEHAKAGIYDHNNVKKGITNYQQAGGEKVLSDYYFANDNHAIIDRSLKKNILFSDHNLVTDKDFCEMNLIMCRNVFIYFTEALRNKVLNNFYESLCRQGYLCLGAQETLLNLSRSKHFECFLNNQNIFRKKN